MAALAPQRIQIVDSPGIAEPDIRSFPIASGQSYIAGAILTLSGGSVAESADNPGANAVLGVALHDAGSVYPTNSVVPSSSSLFGRTFVGTKLFPQDPSHQRVVLLHNNQYFEISLVQAWSPSLIGTTAGLKKDPTTGFWVLDNTLTNKYAVIVAKAEGPASFKGTVGDTGARVVAVMLPAGLVM